MNQTLTRNIVGVVSVIRIGDFMVHGMKKTLVMLLQLLRLALEVVVLLLHVAVVALATKRQCYKTFFLRH
jgi:hypothetical protein